MTNTTIPESWTASWEVVTPTIAADWLAHNNRNRKPNSWRRFVDDMKNDRWVPNGASIAFADDGTLLDGQNRLMAIVETDTAIPCVIVRGLPISAQDTTDIGDRRTLGNQLQIHGTPNAGTVASGLRYRVAFERWMANDFNPFSFTTMEGIAAMEATPNAAEVASKASCYGNKTPAKYAAGLMAGVWLAVQSLASPGPDEVDAFFTTFHEYNVGLRVPDDRNDPIWMLREGIVNRRASSLPGAQLPTIWLAAMTVKAWNLHRDGATVKTLKWSKNEKFPTPHA